MLERAFCAAEKRDAEARRTAKCWVICWRRDSSVCFSWFSCSRDIESRSICFGSDMLLMVVGVDGGWWW